MKKFKWFTLIESLMVIAIIWIISTALYNMRNIGNDTRDLRKEAVNIMYKEMTQYIKDFQRNKIWIDDAGNEREIDIFQIRFIDDNSNNTWKNLTMGNLYIKEEDSWFTWHFESITVISWEKYNANQKIKWIDNYVFKIQQQNENWIIYFDKDWWKWTWDPIILLNETHTASNEIERPDAPTNEQLVNTCITQRNTCINKCSRWRRTLSRCLNRCLYWDFLTPKPYKTRNCDQVIQSSSQYGTVTSTEEFELGGDTTDETTNPTIKFIICAWKSNEEIQPVWRITINVVSASTSLERCNNDKTTNGIDCWPCN